MSKIIHKENVSSFGPGLECVLSTMDVDAYGDIVGDPADPMLGWDLKDFRRNPIALWSHSSRDPIGTWKDVSVTNSALRGRLHLAPPGSTKLVDELRALLAADVLKGVSVGFAPTEMKPRGNSGGTHFLRQRLIEASLVATPANPAALLTAKALGVSKQTIQKIFKQSEDDFLDMEDCVVQMIEDGMDADEAVAFCSVNQEQRLAKALKARDRALAEVKSIDDQIANEYSWTEQRRRQTEKTIANYTRQAGKHRDPPKATYDPDNAPYGSWRGQKLPGPTWRGKPVK
jgi:HK97 family phage prohead protease